MNKNKEKIKFEEEFEILEILDFSTFKARVLRELELKNEKKEPKKRKPLSIRKRHWIYLIDNNKLVCPASGLIVNYCTYDYKKSCNSYHYNFRSKDNLLFTIDHKIPKQKGGTNDFSNVQPMIAEYNFKKKSQLIYTK